MARRGRSFWIYLGATLLALILINAREVGDWGVAHGQTAPGRHPGVRAAEATPGGPAGAVGADPVSGAGGATPSPAGTIPATTVVGVILVSAGLASIVGGVLARIRRRRRTASGVGPNLTSGSGHSEHI